MLWSSQNPQINMPMCPIVSACGTATYNTANVITIILQNYCGKSSSYVKDSTDFTQKIKHLSINPKEEALVSFDNQCSLHQHISTYCTTSYQFQKCLLAPISPMSARSLQKKFIKLLKFTISNCIFCFNKKFYKELQGSAMGTSVSPVIANI